MRLASVLILVLIMLTLSCSKEKLNEIDTTPNYPLDVPIKQLIPAVTASVPFYVNGTELSWYSSVFVEHSAGADGDMRRADRRVSINSELVENSWLSLYTSVLINLKIIIDKGSLGGEEEGNWQYVGMAQVLYAYTFSTITDLWGQVPFSQALMGSENRKPTYDNQQYIYHQLQRLLDEAIVNLDKSSTETPGAEDFIYGGDTDKWIKAAWGLKARLYNHLSNIDAIAYADSALNAIKFSFESADDDMQFAIWGGSDDVEHQNPWYRETQELRQLAVSQTLYNIMDSINDPRVFLMFQGNAYAPNGATIQGENYAIASDQVVYPDAPIPMITYEELRFIKAECHLRKGDKNYAHVAYLEGLESAMAKFNLGNNDSAYAFYMAQEDVDPGQEKMAISHIIKQKYISFYPFQSIEAFNDWRRTGLPALHNVIGTPPLRLPYPQAEISSNGANVPSVQTTDGVWWDDATE